MQSKLSRPESQSAPPAGKAEITRNDPATPPSDIHASLAPPTGTLNTTPGSPEAANASVRRFGPYLITKELGRGGMGIVYRAHDPTLNRSVALKMIRGGVSGPEETERFFREAKAVAQLKHPHIVKIHDFGQIDGVYYFTMELAEAGSLSLHRDRLAKDIRSAVVLMEKVARAVHYVHESNLLHRDLKPGNILLASGDEPIVSDFGLAKQVESTDAALTRTGEVPGTPPYMAPEQASGSGAACRATDIWSLGVILYELVCGRRPFTGPSDAKVKEAIIHGDPPDPRSLQPKVDRSLEAVILKCLKKDHTQRYATAAKFADDLGRWLRGEPTEARPLSWPRRMVRRHRKTLLGVAGIVLLAAAAIAGYTFVPDRQPRRSEPPDPDIVLKRDILPLLESKKPAVLLGATGKPGWSKWIFQGGEFTANDGTFGFHAGAVSMLELVPSLPVDRFVFRAEVRQKITTTGTVGIYCCRTGHPVSWGIVHGHCMVTFSDYGSWKGTANMELSHHAPPHAGWPNGYFPRHAGGAKLSFTPTQKVELWRKIAVKVTPDEIRWCWNDQWSAPLENADRLSKARSLSLRRPNLEGVSPEFPPVGGVGLYVKETGASFRNVAIEPLVD